MEELKLKVLFVDDEPNIINGLRHSLYLMRKKWEMHFALSGVEALYLLSKNEIDVIVTDLRMPIMDGAELLTKVKEQYPQVIRIILSGHSDKEMTLRAAENAHQFLVKPCDTDTLRNVIEQKISARKHLENNQLIKIINGIDTLPILPDLFFKLESELKSQNVSMQHVAALISRDISMTAKILQLGNTAFFGLPTKINDPLQAVNYLGIDVIQALVLYIHIFSATKVPEEIRQFIQNLWEHSIKTAKIARALILLEGSRDNKESSDAYIAGLLHDIGKLVLNTNPANYDAVLDVMEKENLSYDEAEHKALGVTHEEVGAYLLELWGLGATVVGIVGSHHSVPVAGANPISPAIAVYAANKLSIIADTNPDELDDAAKIITHFPPEFISTLHLEEKIDDWLKIVKKMNNGDE